jgi:hypothetical protein
VHELTTTFTCLYAQYREIFSVTTHEGENRASLMATIRYGFPGVYLIGRKNSHQPLYIGSAGKIGPDLRLSGSNVKTRLFSATTPYHFDRISHVWRYGPIMADLAQTAYIHEVPIVDLMLTIFNLPLPYSPAVLEHLLLQGFINEFDRLPTANQRI